MAEYTYGGDLAARCATRPSRVAHRGETPTVERNAPAWFLRTRSSGWQSPCRRLNRSRSS